jgi:hypothetical protein
MERRLLHVAATACALLLVASSLGAQVSDTLHLRGPHVSSFPTGKAFVERGRFRSVGKKLTQGQCTHTRPSFVREDQWVWTIERDNDTCEEIRGYGESTDSSRTVREGVKIDTAHKAVPKTKP